MCFTCAAQSVCASNMSLLIEASCPTVTKSGSSWTNDFRDSSSGLVPGVEMEKANLDRLVKPYALSLSNCSVVIPCSSALASNAAGDSRIVAMSKS